METREVQDAEEGCRGPARHQTTTRPGCSLQDAGLKRLLLRFGPFLLRGAHFTTSDSFETLVAFRRCRVEAADAPAQLPFPPNVVPQRTAEACSAPLGLMREREGGPRLLPQGERKAITATRDRPQVPRRARPASHAFSQPVAEAGDRVVADTFGMGCHWGADRPEGRLEAETFR